MLLSRHFVERWRERVGGDPNVKEVKKIVRESVYLQRCRSYRLADGMIYRTLAIYWHPEKNMVVKIDETIDMAVTVISPAVKGYRGRRV